MPDNRTLKNGSVRGEESRPNLLNLELGQGGQGLARGRGRTNTGVLSHVLSHVLSCLEALDAVNTLTPPSKLR